MSFKVYKSSAGSGKTFTLVKEYLTLALSNDSPLEYKGIMAVTFTNKAANEMKERVISYLTALSENKYKNQAELLIKNQLLDTLKISEVKLIERAASTLKSILHNYSDFNISTIDKFILKIIRSFSLDFQIPFNFDVEMDTDNILNIAVENVIAEAGENKELTTFLLNYVTQQAEEDGNWNLVRTLSGIAKKTLNDDSSKFVSSLAPFSFQDFFKARKHCENQISEYLAKVRHLLEQGQFLLQSNDVQARHLVGLSRGKIYTYFFSLDDSKLFELANQKSIEQFDSNDWSHKKCDSSTASRIADIQADLYDIYTKVEHLKKAELDKVKSYQVVTKHLFQLALVNEIEKQVKSLKNDRNFIHIAEFNQKVAEIVVQQPIPFIYERIGERFKNYLIDEFQDTSELQWQNLMPLIENSLAYGNFNLVVGDVKQAIYRWRGGNVDQFQNIGNPINHNLPLVQQRAKRIASYLEEDRLTVNYRSFPEVIKFNNLFFKTLLEAIRFDFKHSYYSDFHQDIGSKQNGGYVEIVVHEKSNEITEADFFLEECLLTIKDVVRRGKNYQDITILSRRHHSLQLIGKFLSSQGIPILSSVSLSLGQSADLQFIMSVFKLVNNPADIGAMVKILEFICEPSKLAMIHSSIFADKKQAYQNLETFLSKHYKKQLPNIHNVGLYDAIENIIRNFSLDKNDPFIQKLLDIANAKQEETSQEFIEWWNDKKDKTYISSPEGINAVKLMTIHKAKGLEFPVVIYPFANGKKGHHENLIWAKTEKLQLDLPYVIVGKSKQMIDSTLAPTYELETEKELLDDLNAIYVALTRAVEELYIMIREPSKAFKEKSSIEMSEEFFFPVLEHLPKEDFRYVHGSKSSSAASKTNKTADNELIVPPNKDWKNKIKLSYSAPSIWNVPLTSEDNFDLLDPRKFGNLIHSVLAQLQTDMTVDKVLSEFAKNGHLLPQDVIEIKKTVTKVLELPLLKKIWQTGKHIIEREFIDEKGKIYRPDRIIITSKNTFLIDFKTGKKQKKDIRQIEQYKNILTNLNYSNISAFLVYTDPVAAVEV